MNIIEHYPHVISSIPNLIVKYVVKPSAQPMVDRIIDLVIEPFQIVLSSLLHDSIARNGMHWRMGGTKKMDFIYGLNVVQTILINKKLSDIFLNNMSFVK